MRRSLALAAGLLLLAGLLVGCQHLRLGAGPALAPPGPGTVRVATWNVHYILRNQPEGRWGLAGWEERKGPLDATFRAIGADIVAFQEMETFAGGNDDSLNLAREWLLANNPGYAAAAIGDWRSFPSTQPILYRRDRFEVLDQGWFFFSDTPDLIYSRTFNGSYPAFASWARLRDRQGGSEIRVLNMHLDYASRENRRRSVDLVVGRIAPWIAAGERVVLAGDLNALAGSGLHRRLRAAGLRFVAVDGATYHLDRGLNLFGAIDHIGFAGPIAPVRPPVVFRDRLGPVWPSDHYPLIADFALQGGG